MAQVPNAITQIRDTVMNAQQLAGGLNLTQEQIAEEREAYRRFIAAYPGNKQDLQNLLEQTIIAAIATLPQEQRELALNRSKQLRLETVSDMMVFPGKRGREIGAMPIGYEDFTRKALFNRFGANALPDPANHGRVPPGDFQSVQVQHIVEAMDTAIGSEDKTNYFRLREVALITKWDLIIESLKRMHDMIPKEQSDINLPDLITNETVFNIAFAPSYKAKFLSVPVGRKENRGPGERDIDYTFVKLSANVAKLYLSSDTNVDLGAGDAGLDIWMQYRITKKAGTTAAQWQEIIFKINEYGNTLVRVAAVVGGQPEGAGRILSRTDGIDNIPLAGDIRGVEMQLVNPDGAPRNIPNSFYVLTRMARLKKNDNKWKYEFKARTGVFKRIYETIIPKISFAGFNSDLNAFETSEVITSNNANAFEQHRVELAEMTLYFGGNPGMLGSPDDMFGANTPNINIKSYRFATNAQYVRYLTAMHNLNRAYYGKKSSLQQNADRRLKKFLSRDNRMINKVKNFLGK